MSQPKRKYDSTVARIAGNILSGMGLSSTDGKSNQNRVVLAVGLARAVVAEVERTEPEKD